jgi:hypothetical protein
MTGRIFIGETHIVPYPFFQTVYTGHDENGGYEAPCWRPGTQGDHDSFGGWVHSADGMGEMILEVVGRFKPAGPYPERTFFVRRWRDPNGNEFGKTKLRITTSQAFMRLTKGYRHEYELSGEPGPVMNAVKRLESAEEEGWR